MTVEEIAAEKNLLFFLFVTYDTELKWNSEKMIPWQVVTISWEGKII